MKPLENSAASVHCRPYDAAIPPEILAAVKRRRDSPDGDPHKVKFAPHWYYGEMAQYPWDKMKDGDFFFVPLKGRPAAALRTRFKNVALRRDFEITVVSWNLGTVNNPVPGLRVTLSYSGRISKLREILGLPTPNFIKKANQR